MHTKIGSCRHFKMPGPDFAGESTGQLIALTYHCTLKSTTNHQQMCLLFSWTQPTLQKHFQIPTYKTHSTNLNSNHVSKLCSYLFILDSAIDRKNCLQRCLFWLLIEEHYSKPCGNCSNCKLRKCHHLTEVFWLSLLTC